MFHWFFAVSVAVSLLFQSVPAVSQDMRLQPPPTVQVQPKDGITTKEALTDAAIVVLIIAASIAAYKALGKPCACPSDTAKNGSSCGARSAHSRAGGYKPLCFPTDITGPMIPSYRATKTIPPIF